MEYLKVRARFFGFYRELVGISQADLEVEERISLADLKQKLAEVFPPLQVFSDNLLLAVNGEYGSDELDLKDGDEIAVLPPLGGGSDIEVTTDPISTEAVADKVKRDSYGALVTFAGRVRDNSEGQRVLYMEYEAFQEMAQKKLTEIADEVRARWQPLDIAISHRVGRLEVGEVALAIAVASPHRKEAFAACQYAVDRIKEIVPIWKKEIREDGGVWMTQ
jgi:molybdopterin synthase catalytic subunit/molybdopterin converting factor small subunit